MISKMCAASEMPCDGPKALSRLQISFTFTGWLVTFSGGSLGGEIASRKFCQKVRCHACQSTAMRERIGPRAALGVLLKYSFRLSRKLVPNSSFVNTTVAPVPWTLTDRSVKKSLRLETKPSERRRSPAPKRGVLGAEGEVLSFGSLPVKFKSSAMSV